MAATYPRRNGLLALALLASLAFAALIADIDPHHSIARATATPSPRARPTILTLTNAPYGRPIAPGFVGLSLEYTALEPYTGTDPRHLNPAFVRLIGRLGPQPSLRIGGDSTDWTWAPTTAITKPPGIRYAITRTWIALARRLTLGTHARLILGLNLEANRRALATAEARTLIRGIGRSSIAALEVGNEPELYRSFGWYRTALGTPVPGRPRDYTPAAFNRDFSRFAAALPRLPVAGPAIGGQQWIRDTGAFVAAQRRLQIVTLHRYPLQRCHLPAASHLYPTIAHLLSNEASGGLAAGVAGYAATAHARGLPFRLDEINNVSCGGRLGVSDTFAAALWSLNTLFELARVGVDGVNIHTFPRAAYAPFAFTHAHGRWRATVAPEFYGLLLFAQAAPAGARLLALAGALPPGLHAWATHVAGGRTHVVLINDSTTHARTIALRLRGAGTATLTRLAAPAPAATAGTTLGGQSFTPTGRLAGPSRTTTVRRSPAGYTVNVPAASAAMLTLAK